MKDVTEVLSRIEQGDPTAAEQLLPLIYHELREVAQAKLRNERAGHTLQATALVHEAYLRLVGSGGEGQSWTNRGHFFAAAAEAMRRILVESVRQKNAVKRGGGAMRIELDTIHLAEHERDAELLALDAAIDGLEELDPVKASLDLRCRWPWGW